MRMDPRWGVAMLLATAGCVKQDTEILNRVSRKIADRATTTTADLRERLPFRLTTVAPPSLADRVQQRLASDKLLEGTSLTVVMNGLEVEIKGIAERDDQKKRAVELAESTVGVERVIDSINLP